MENIEMSMMRRSMTITDEVLEDDLFWLNLEWFGEKEKQHNAKMRELCEKYGHDNPAVAFYRDNVFSYRALLAGL